MNRDTGTTMKPITPLDTRFWQHNAIHEFLAILCCTNVFSVRTCADFHVWCTNYGILTTNVNPVTAPRSGAVAEPASLNAL